MTYAPNDSDAWVPETPGSTPAWNTLISNDADLYSEASAMFAVAYGPYISGSAGAAYRSCYFALPANYDQLPFRVDFGYTQTGTSSTVRLYVTDGSSTESAVTTVTASSGTDSVTVRPSSTSASSTPRYGYLDITAANTKIITLTSIFVWLIPEAPGTGVRSSGYISVDTSWSSNNAPIPSEILATLQNNPTKIAMDRPAAIYSVVLPSESADRGQYSTNSGTMTVVTKVMLPVVKNTKTWRVWAYVERTSTAKADILIALGNQFLLLPDDEGVMTATFTAGKYDLLGGDETNLLSIRVSSGSGYVALRTLQIMEEPT